MLQASHLGPGTPTVISSAFWWVVGHSDSLCLLYKDASMMMGKPVLPMDIRICIWKAVRDCITLAHGGGRFFTRACYFSSNKFRWTVLGMNSLKLSTFYVHLDNCWLLLRYGCHDCPIGDISPVWSLLCFSGFTASRTVDSLSPLATCVEFSDKWFLISWHTLRAVTSFGTYITFTVLF